MQNLLNTVKVPTIKKSFFDMSHEHKTTFDMGLLIPINAEPLVPSDKVKVGFDSLLRLQPMLAPLMHLVNVYTHTFFVPYRLLWRGNTQNNRWNDFIANIKTLGVLPQVPTLTFDNGNTQQGTLANYLGIPDLTSGAQVHNLCAFNHAAYQCIYNEYYRDENLVPEVDYLLTDGDNSANAELYAIRSRAWEKDYFTASLPFAQKGDAVNIPIGTLQDLPVLHNWESDPPEAFTNLQAAAPSTEDPIVEQRQANAGTGDDIPGSSLWVETSSLDLGATTINDLRLAYTLQRWYEQLARGGTRPNEFLKVIFNVDSPDKRLQRPEYICGSKSPIMISEVLNTTGTEENVQGNMSGHGVGVTKGQQGTYYAQEYGVLMTIMSVMPKTTYYQGIPKQYLKKNDPTEYFMPTFDHLGEQEVDGVEVYGIQAEGSTFGYLPRYAEYKVPISKVTGKFQTDYLFWTLARKFETEPNLNAEFINCDPSKRIFAVEELNNDSVLASIWCDIKIVRPMSKYSTPTF